MWPLSQRVELEFLKRFYPFNSREMLDFFLCADIRKSFFFVSIVTNLVRSVYVKTPTVSQTNWLAARNKNSGQNPTNFKGSRLEKDSLQLYTYRGEHMLFVTFLNRRMGIHRSTHRYIFNLKEHWPVFAKQIRNNIFIILLLFGDRWEVALHETFSIHKIQSDLFC